jgi:hypothetical protein
MNAGPKLPPVGEYTLVPAMIVDSAAVAGPAADDVMLIFAVADADRHP